MFKLFALISVSFYSTFAQGQGLRDTVDSVSKSLQKQNVDTIVGFGTSLVGSAMDINLNGIGKVHPFEIRYLFFRQNAHVYALELVDGCRGDCSKTEIVISKPVEVGSDTILSWIATHLPIIRNEYIYPYIYVLEENGVARYDVARSSHEAFYAIDFILRNEWFGKSVNPTDLMKTRFRTPDNLNYGSNVSTSLSKLYGILNSFFEKIDSRFVF